MENPIKMDDLGVPLFLETPIFTDFESITFITYRLFKSRMNFQQLESSVARFLWTCFGPVGSRCQVTLARSASFGVAQEW